MLRNKQSQASPRVDGLYKEEKPAHARHSAVRVSPLQLPDPGSQTGGRQAPERCAASLPVWRPDCAARSPPSSTRTPERVCGAEQKKGSAAKRQNPNTRHRLGVGLNDGRIEGRSKIQPTARARETQPSNFAIAAPNKSVSPKASRARSFPISPELTLHPRTVKNIIGSAPPSNLDVILGRRQQQHCQEQETGARDHLLACSDSRKPGRPGPATASMWARTW